MLGALSQIHQYSAFQLSSWVAESLLNQLTPAFETWKDAVEQNYVF